MIPIESAVTTPRDVLAELAATASYLRESGRLMRDAIEHLIDTHTRYQATLTTGHGTGRRGARPAPENWPITMVEGMFTALAAKVAALEGQLAAVSAACIWREEPGGAYWESGCGGTWTFISEGGPAQHHARFCHGCGHRIEAITALEAIDAEEAITSSTP